MVIELTIRVRQRERVENSGEQSLLIEMLVNGIAFNFFIACPLPLCVFPLRVLHSELWYGLKRGISSALTPIASQRRHSYLSSVSHLSLPMPLLLCLSSLISSLSASLPSLPPLSSFSSPLSAFVCFPCSLNNISNSQPKY